MKLIGKLCALVLSVALSISLVPMSAFADPEDSTPPSYGSIVASKTEVEPDDTIVFTVEIIDESPIMIQESSEPYIVISNSEGGQAQYVTLMHIEGNTYEGRYTLPEDALAGQWMIQSIFLRDVYGNTTNDILAQPIFTVSAPDTTPPEISQFFALEQNVHPGDMIELGATIMDNEGVVSASMTLFDPEGVEVSIEPMTKDPNTNIWKTNYYVPLDAKEGVWSVSIEALDEAGNRAEVLYTSGFTILFPTTSVEKIDIESSTIIKVGQNAKKLNVAVTPFDATNKALTWTSSAPEVATVDAEGQVTPVKAGIAVITVEAQDGSEVRASCTVTVLPMKVNGVKAVSEKYNAIRISWAEVVGASGYEVYRRATSNGARTLVGTISSGSTLSYLNVGLATGTAYYYEVRAFGMNGPTKVYTGYSSMVNSKPVPPTPSAKAVSTGYNSAKVTWDTVAGASGYEVYRSTGSNGSYAKVAAVTGVNTLSYTDKGLTTGKTYYYKIRAYRMVSGVKIFGAQSVAASVTPIPSKPNNLKATNSGYNSIALSWTKVAGATGYQIYRSTSSGGTYTRVGTVSGGNVTAYLNTGLKTGVTYHYKIRACVKAGSSTTYGKYTAVVNAKPALTKPNSPLAISGGYDRVKVNWVKVPGANGYEIYRSTSSGGTYSLVKTITSQSTSSFTNSGLVLGTSYFYKVRAYRIVDSAKVYSAYSSKVNAKPTLSKIGNSKAETASYQSVKVSWSTVSGASGYEIYRSKSSSGTYTLAKRISNGSTVSFTDAGLITDQTYYYKIRPYRLVSGARIYGAYTTVFNATPRFGTVYWTPNGSVFHVSKNCSTLSKSKTILSGTVSNSGKSRVCKVCG